MNPLLQKFARRVVHVLTLPAITEGDVTRPAIDLYVRAITGAEFFELGARVNKAEGTTAQNGVQLEAYVCDAEGNALLAPGEGTQWMGSIEAGAMRRLIKAGDKLNALTDDAVEEELKN